MRVLSAETVNMSDEEFMVDDDEEYDLVWFDNAGFWNSVDSHSLYSGHCIINLYLQSFFCHDLSFVQNWSHSRVSLTSDGSARPTALSRKQI